MKCVDLFSGCGGLSKGLENSGFEIVAAVENWKPSIEVYKSNFKHPVIEHDLSDVDSSIKLIESYEPEIIVGGPPCQDFSSAGKRDHTGTRADLTYCFADIVNSVKPKWFIMENVEPIKKSHVLKDVVDQYISNEYGLSAVILDASYCGVPQARTRFFLIGELNGSHNRLLPVLRNSLADKRMTMRDYFGGALGLDFYYRHPRNYNRRGIFSMDEPSPTVRGVNRPIPKGYSINSCDPDGVALEDIRPLTTIERSYVQTFPKKFKFPGNKTNLEQMIGNAVPVNLAEFVGKAIKSYLIDKNPKYTDELVFGDHFEIPTSSLKPRSK